MILNSYAKLNLYLEVLNKRKDNYHSIKTVFERIGLADKIILKSRRDKKIKIICNLPHVPEDKTNLCYESAKLLQDGLKVNQGVDIRIIKRIPVSAGLGGGSSNAAAVLLGLNKIWGLGLSRAKLVAFGKKIGSDVPFFLYGCPFAEGSSRGDRIRPIPALNKVRLWHILIVPGIKVSTPLIYRKWDIGTKRRCGIERAGLTPHLFRYSKTPKYLNKIKGAGLTKPKYDAKILTSAIRKKDLCLIGEALFNSLEQVSAKLYPQITQIKESLRQMAIKSILMSGSGPAVFGVVSSRKEAVAAGRQLRRKNRLWQVFVTKTI